ncbi:MAG: tetratricopeptide repeat protein [Planctomycetes bacterium]|nr:tetratricopeptide repeat protein [Planctomycetota bacterium]
MRKPLVYAISGVALVAAGVLVAWFTAFREPTVQIDQVLAAYEENKEYGGLTIDYPLDQTLFPPEIPAPTFRWQDDGTDSDTWLVTIRFQDGGDRTSFLTRDTRWTPTDDQWETIKRRSRKKEAAVTVLGVRRKAPQQILSGASVFISTSEDEVGAPLFYREVHLPFAKAVADPAAHIKWRFGMISSKEQPPVVLEKLPVCGNCHSFSSNGTCVGMDVDYANDKGSYVICPVTEEIVLDDNKIITWSDYQREDGDATFGLLSQISPDGRYVVSTVKDFSVFVPLEDLEFSQLFFPVKGILVVYDRNTGEFHALPGADDKRFVQSNPVWSPDGKYIVFARNEAYYPKKMHKKKTVLLDREDCAEFIDGGKKFKFDLYRIPFNGGQGGKPEPLAGAANDGMSNYFPKYSPDGKWIVFCKAESFMLLQPGSELYIIPAAGGEARRLRCNSRRMNSWHSWSPNGRWLVFSSKARSPYTQLLLTHIDTDGRSSPPVELDRFTTSKTAANIPEFVNATAGAIKTIRQQFVDGESYFRAGLAAYSIDDFDAAERAYRMAFSLDPKHAEAIHGLGVVLAFKEEYDEAEGHFLKAIELDPEFAGAHKDLGSTRGRQGKFQEAIAPFRDAIRINPDDAECHMMLGATLSGLGQVKEAQTHMDLAIRLDAVHADAREIVELADGHLTTGNLDEARDHYRRAV